MLELKIIAISFFLSLNSLALASNFSNSNKPIPVTKSNPSFSLKLKSNPSTGFSWYLIDYDKNLLQPVRHKYYAPDSKLAGAWGYEEWTFRVKPEGFTVPQVINLQLAYIRPWDVSTYKPTTFKVITHDN
ncbi:MAG: protease inhibitor I42 family protein [Gammaproteobacteria bacterium]|nr:protease inhibitor I42 family protein [Gammaproteobacteria bacterium]